MTDTQRGLWREANRDSLPPLRANPDYIPAHRPGDRVTVTEDATVILADTLLHIAAGAVLTILDTRPNEVRVQYGRPVWIPARLVEAAQ